MTRPQRRAATPLFHLYRAATTMLVPLAYRKIRQKLAAQGISDARQRERLGYPTQLRPQGQLIWLHGASVGESLAALTLIEHLSTLRPDAHFLLTSGTATSAEMAQKRLPSNAIHQFAPLDGSQPVNRFLTHWQPDAAIFVESELWPVTLHDTAKRNIPIALVNARLSQKSFANWRKRSDTAAFVMDQFSLVLAQNDAVATQLTQLGARDVHPAGNLKAGAAPLPVDHTTLNDLRDQLQGRPVWIASSTHPGEEDTVLAAHKALLEQFPDLLLLLAPRHPERGSNLMTQIQAADLTVVQRSAGKMPTPATQVYLADTLGEVGTWYALSPIVFLGGSLLPIGGHNPFEVARAGAAILTGPGYSNFMETFPALIDAGGAVEVATASQLSAAVTEWLYNADTQTRAQTAAQHYLAQQTDQLDQTLSAIVQMLDHAKRATG
ncbi:3-deoxy-D-manno-octulosonic acid transferase [Epibacterium ulvae]|uniref:3-deoxy-D-manno-octulosonic acid transferase n=1 Tax=Epibacterium ulvae TaxID=1156985 RepID=UPI00248FBE68|nr:3-deoxy-D-manno-octulosonic acid transferase [Epibacterium ulvae]